MEDGGPAFPDMRQLQLCKSTDLSDEARENVYTESRGMSLRDYFAAKAMQGMLANPNTLGANGLFNETNIQAAFDIADRMLKARES